MDTKVIVDRIEESKVQSGVFQAMLRMEVHRVQGENNLRSSLFSAEELGKETFIEKRVDFIDVPKGATVEEVQARIDSLPNARIYRALSDKPIMSNSQIGTIQNGLSGEAFENFKQVHGIEADSWNDECRQALLTNIANNQMVRYGENFEGKDAQEPVLRNGKPQYRITRFYFGDTPKEDVSIFEPTAVKPSLEIGVNPEYVETLQQA